LINSIGIIEEEPKEESEHESSIDGNVVKNTKIITDGEANVIFKNLKSVTDQSGSNKQYS